jgi:hypothetical protein
MILWEIVDSEVDINWIDKSTYELGAFKLDEKMYVIQIRRIHVPGVEELSNKRTAEVSFFRGDIEDVERAHSTLGDVLYPFKIYGVVFNALVKKFQEYDAFFFTAERRHSGVDFDKKIKLYDTLAHRLSRRVSGIYYYNVTVHDAEEFLLSKVEIKNPKYVNKLKEALNRIDWSSVPTLKLSKP